VRKIARVLMDRLIASVNDVPVPTKTIKVSNIKESNTASNTAPQQ
jgi:hypothetical protein